MTSINELIGKYTVRGDVPEKTCARCGRRVPVGALNFEEHSHHYGPGENNKHRDRGVICIDRKACERARRKR